MIGLAIILGLGGVSLAVTYLSVSNGRPDDHTSQTIDTIEHLLPQTQCGKCHYAGCRPYAEAIALGKSDINLCPPGGDNTVRAIARVVGVDPKPLAAGIVPESTQKVALIDEDLCIGCVKCIRACPVDAILGAPGRMHTVIKKSCTGCELCLPACPVDCISMAPVRVKTREWVWSKPDPSAGLEQ